MVGQMWRKLHDNQSGHLAMIVPRLFITCHDMFHALSAGLTLAMIIVVLKLFLPEIAASLIELIIKILAILNIAVDQAGTNLPY
ncbi:MAG: hypothetical protein CMI53_00220 [Parcubacteria group bacterium]|nr:hypothetical protein [Parcubacteria group bacterium]